ncbi:MAG: bestrophin family protein, partial [Flammeovirgaceae bacterium]
FAWRNLLFFTLWASLITTAFIMLKAIDINISIPFLPLSTIGIAVAFYIGFKNNQSYDRFWEGRKIWGGIVNYSRTWAVQVLGFVSNLHASEPVSADELKLIHQRLIYRHLAWINALRMQLRQTTIFDRKNLSYTPNFKLHHDRDCDEGVGKFLDLAEYNEVLVHTNTASQLVKNQGHDLRELCARKLIDDFRHMEMMRIQEECYNLQGKCERIKNTPFPRQYAYFSTLFTWIFVFLLPFGLVGEFGKLGHHASVWLTIPFSVLISWIFTTMEIVGDNSEDPFENYVNDVPMTALCRTIEVDLREMLGETDIPPKIQPINDVLM